MNINGRDLSANDILKLAIPNCEPTNKPMPNINKVIVAGHLTRDPETKYTPSGTAVSQVGLAVTHKYKANEQWVEQTTFIDIELWGKTAESAGKYLSKGAAVMFEGRLKLDQWDDKQTGQKRSKMKVVGDTMHFLGKSEGKTSEPRPQPRPVAKPVAPPADPDLDPEETIPF